MIVDISFFYVKMMLPTKSFLEVAPCIYYLNHGKKQAKSTNIIALPNPTGRPVNLTSESSGD